MKRSLSSKYTNIPDISIGILVCNKKMETLLKEWLEKDAALFIYANQDSIDTELVSRHHIFLLESNCDDIDTNHVIEVILQSHPKPKIIVFFPLSALSKDTKYDYVHHEVTYIISPFNDTELRYNINNILE